MLDHDDESLQPDEIISTFYDFNNARIEILIFKMCDMEH